VVLWAESSTFSEAEVTPSDLVTQRDLGLVVPAERDLDVVRVEVEARSERRRLRLRAVLVTVDVAVTTLAVLLVTVLHGGLDGPNLLVDPLVVAVAVLSLALAGLYKSRVASVRARELARLVPVSAITSVALYLGYAAVDDPLALGDVLVFGVALLALLVAPRSAFDDWLRAQRREGRFCRSTVILGTGPEAVALASLIDDHPELGYRIVGIVGPIPVDPAPTLPWLGETDDVAAVLAETEANGVFVTSEWVYDPARRALVRGLAAAKVHVHLSGGMWGIDHRRLRPVAIAHEPLFYLEEVSLRPYQSVVKRAVDLVVAPIALVLATPVLLVAALAIKLEDGGPVLYVQPRVGRDGRLFGFLKLRTMVVNADRIPCRDRGDNARSGPLYKATDDPRVTRVGRFLRASSIDELPQLLNVIWGDMALVGPRPALPSEVEDFDEELLERNRVRPGITGLWQVEARDNPSFNAYRRLDLFYIENWTLSLDVIILTLTVQHVAARCLRAGFRLGQRRRKSGVGV
jgi:exopolysaccharide biosynthesis polyprenyl glycosylphosphotransferase